MLTLLASVSWLDRSASAVLRSIETAKVRNKKDDELTAAIRHAEDACLPLHSNRKSDPAVLDEQRRKDHISHYILRLAFCRTYVWRLSRKACARCRTSSKTMSTRER